MTILYPLKPRTLSCSSRTIDDFLGHALSAVLQIQKCPSSERGQLYAAHKDADPRMVGIRILMALTPDYLCCRCRLVLQSCPTLCDSMNWSLSLLCPWNSPVKNTGMGCHAFLQGIFPSQGSNLGLLHAGRFFTTEPPGKPFPHQLTTNQSEKCAHADHALLIEHCKPPHYPFQGGRLGHQPPMDPFAWQSNKAILFYFTQNCLHISVWHN